VIMCKFYAVYFIINFPVKAEVSFQNTYSNKKRRAITHKYI